MGTGPLFKRQAMDARMHAIMRTEFGWSEECIAQIADEDVAYVIENETYRRACYAEHLEKGPSWIEAGYLTEDEFAAMTRAELRAFAVKVRTFEKHQAAQRGENYYTSLARRSKPAQKVEKEAQPVAIDTLSREAQLALHANMLTVIAAQQAQIDQLRQELASVRNLKLAVFGHQQVIDQLTTVSRDFEGVEVHMTLEDQVTESEEGALTATETSAGSVKDARDAVAGIEGLASLIAGLNISRKVNLDSLNEVARKMSERSKSQMKSRNKGEVHLKFAKVSGGAAALATGSGGIHQARGPATAANDGNRAGEDAKPAT